MAQFKAGDVVTLKSGGPAMTVEKTVASDQVVCKWFDGKEMKVASFVPDTLQPAKPPHRGVIMK